MNFTLVTGGAKNLGREICLHLAAHQFNVAVHYNKSEKEALQVVKECQAYGVFAEAIHGDFSSNDGLEKFIEMYLKQFPNTKNLVNNVGNYLVKSALETSFEEMTDLFQVNVFACLSLSKALLPSIKMSQGSIVNIGVAGIDRVKAECYSTAYSMTKLCLLMLTRSLAKELGAFNVAVNMVSPGVLSSSIDALENLENIPMKRFGCLNEVADVVAFLLNQKNHYITGQNIEVAGGVRL